MISPILILFNQTGSMPQASSTTSLTLLDRLRLWLPGDCLVCSFPARRVISLCRYCENRLPGIRHYCRSCGVALNTANSSGRCGACLVKPPPFTFCRGLYHYRKPVDKLLADFKYHGNFASGRALAWLLAEEFHRHYHPATGASTPPDQAPQLLVPVPLHAGRQRKRGFNQAELLCRVISTRTAIPCSNRLLTRTRNTAPQSQLPAHRRAANLHNAFRISAQLSRGQIRHVAVIDDVVTTTATVRSVTRALQRSTIERVDVWAIARA